MSKRILVVAVRGPERRAAHTHSATWDRTAAIDR